jgi:hypothetical protein
VDRTLEESQRRVKRFGFALACGAFVAICTKTVDTVRDTPVGREEECTTTLRYLCLVEQGAIADGGAPIVFIESLPARPERGNRYAYFVGGPGPMEQRLGMAEPKDPLATSISNDTSQWGARAPGKLDAPRQVQAEDAPQAVAGELALGATGCPGPGCSHQAACVGDIDADDDFDVWSVSTKARKGPQGPIPACEPFHERDDLAK